MMISNLISGFRWVNLTVAFLLELCALGALGYWGVRTGNGLGARIALALAAPFAAAVLWGLFAAPSAVVSVPLLRIVTQIVVFGSAAGALYATGQRRLALIFVLLIVVNSVLVFATGGTDGNTHSS